MNNFDQTRDRALRVLQLPLDEMETISVATLKQLIADWPETDCNGEPTELWIGNSNGTSNPAKWAGPLNYRQHGGKWWADLIIE